MSEDIEVSELKAQLAKQRQEITQLKEKVYFLSKYDRILDNAICLLNISI